MLGSQQAKIIGILRTEFEKNSEKYLSIKEIYNILVDSNGDLASPSYTTISTILKRLADQKKVNFYEEGNRNYYQFKDIKNQVSDKLLSTFVRAFGPSGIAYLIEKSKNLSEKDIQDLKDLIDKEN